VCVCGCVCVCVRISCLSISSLALGIGFASLKCAQLNARPPPPTVWRSASEAYVAKTNGLMAQAAAETRAQAEAETRAHAEAEMRAGEQKGKEGAGILGSNTFVLQVRRPCGPAALRPCEVFARAAFQRLATNDKRKCDGDDEGPHDDAHALLLCSV